MGFAHIILLVLSLRPPYHVSSEYNRGPASITGTTHREDIVAYTYPSSHRVEVEIIVRKPRLDTG